MCGCVSALTPTLTRVQRGRQDWHQAANSGIPVRPGWETPSPGAYPAPSRPFPLHRLVLIPADAASPVPGQPGGPQRWAAEAGPLAAAGRAPLP